MPKSCTYSQVKTMVKEWLRKSIVVSKPQPPTCALPILKFKIHAET